MKHLAWIIPLVIIFVIAISLAVYLRSTITPQQTGWENAQIFKLKGVVSVQNTQTKQRVDAQEGMAVSRGDSIQTYGSSFAEIRFGEKRNDFVKIDEQTKASLQLNEKENADSLNLKEGKVFALIRSLKAGSKFQVNTSVAVCGVRGTGVEVESKEDTSTFKVHEGEAEVITLNRFGQPTEEAVLLEEGYKTTVGKTERRLEEPVKIAEAEKEEWETWKEEIEPKPKPEPEPEPELKPEAEVPEEPSFVSFGVFIDDKHPENHFAPSGWIGDYDAIKMEFVQIPYSGKDCLKFTYSGKTPQGASWVGVLWQNPVNNWGEIDGRYDLRGAMTLTFWAKGEFGGEVIKEFNMGSIRGQFPDSDSARIGPVILTKDWRQYSIDLRGKNLSGISGGFGWIALKSNNPDGFIIYLDEIKYE